MLYSQLDTKKSRVLEFSGLETTSVSNNYLVPYVGAPLNAGMNGVVEIEHNGTIIHKRYVQNAVANDLQLHFDLSGYAGVKKIKYKLLSSSINNGAYNCQGVYDAISYTPSTLGKEFNKFEVIILGFSVIGAEVLTPNLTHIENNYGKLKQLRLRAAPLLQNVSNLISLNILDVELNNQVNDVTNLINLTSIKLGEGATISDLTQNVNLKYIYINSSASQLAGGLQDIFPYINDINDTIYIRGNFTHNGTVNFNPNINILLLASVAGSSITSQDVSNILIDASNSYVNNGVSGRVIDFINQMPAPIYDTATNAAIADLTAKGITVLLNP